MENNSHGKNSHSQFVSYRFKAFFDTESYLKDLSEEALNLQGGLISSPQLEREQTLRPTSLSFCVEF